MSQRLHSPVRQCLVRRLAHCHLMRPTPTDHLFILSDIQPAELRRLEATLSLAYRESLDPDHILYVFLSGSSDACQKRLQSRCPFLPAVRNLLNYFDGLGIRASQ